LQQGRICFSWKNKRFSFATNGWKTMLTGENIFTGFFVV